MGKLFADVIASWERHDRTGSPRLLAQVNAVLGPQEVVETARAELLRYYGDIPYVEHIMAGLLTTPEQIRAAISAYASVGADEVMLYCWAPDPDQLDRIAEAL